MKVKTKSNTKFLNNYFSDIITKKENKGNDFISEKDAFKNDKTFIKLNKLLTKLIDVENDKVDALRLVTMYIESSGRDINLPKLIGFLKS